MRRGFWIAGSLASGAVVATSCADPTEVTVKVTTTEACTQIGGVAIAVGPDPTTTQQRYATTSVEAATKNCQDPGGFIGTLVVTPGKTSGSILVAAGVKLGNQPAPDATQCLVPANASSCIIARRSFSFVSHTPLTLPIELDFSCIGIPCSEDSTCFKGACIADVATCSGDECGLPQENPGGSGTDASTSDGTYDADIFSDGSGAMSDGSMSSSDASFDTGTAVDGSSTDAGINQCKTVTAFKSGAATAYSAQCDDADGHGIAYACGAAFCCTCDCVVGGVGHGSTSCSTGPNPTGSCMQNCSP